MLVEAARILLCVFTVYGAVRLVGDIIDYYLSKQVRKISSAVLRITSLPTDENDMEYALDYYRSAAEKMNVDIKEWDEGE